MEILLSQIRAKLALAIRVGKKDNKRTGVWWLTKEGCSQANVWVNALCFLQCYDTDE